MYIHGTLPGQMYVVQINAVPMVASLWLSHILSITYHMLLSIVCLTAKNLTSDTNYKQFLNTSEGWEEMWRPTCMYMYMYIPLTHYSILHQLQYGV